MLVNRRALCVFSARQFTREQEGPDNRVCKALITGTLKARQDNRATSIRASGLVVRHEITHAACTEDGTEIRTLDLNIRHYKPK